MERIFMIQQKCKRQRSAKEGIGRKVLCFLLMLMITAITDVFPSGCENTPLTIAAQAASSPYMEITCIDLGSARSVYGESVLLKSGDSIF